jgi:hypothetical protein
MATDWMISDVTNALKSNAMPGADESYRYCEAVLSQQVCAVSSETSSRLSFWNVDGAYSNLSCTIVLEEGRQKSKRLSYTAKFKRELIWCAEEKGNCKATVIFGVDESNVWLWRKHKAAISGCEVSQRKFIGPKKRQFPEIDDAVFTFFQERRKTGLFLSYDLLLEEAIKNARSLNIPRSCFKGWAIRFMRRMGVALWHRTMVCQKLPKDMEQKLLNYQQYIIFPKSSSRPRI